MMAKHFAEQELGEQVDFSTIQQDAIARQNYRLECTGNTKIDHADVISIIDFGNAVAKAENNKAVGLDGLSLSISNADNRDFIRLYYPLVLKQALCVAEPVQAKGGN
jgi:hypothetical protein